jgi:hypothetical protein
MRHIIFTSLSQSLSMSLLHITYHNITNFTTTTIVTVTISFFMTSIVTVPAVSSWEKKLEFIQFQADLTRKDGDEREGTTIASIIMIMIIIIINKTSMLITSSSEPNWNYHNTKLYTFHSLTSGAKGDTRSLRLVSGIDKQHLKIGTCRDRRYADTWMSDCIIYKAL